MGNKKLTLNGYWIYAHHVHDRQNVPDFPSAIAIADVEWEVWFCIFYNLLHRLPVFRKWPVRKKMSGRQWPRQPWKRWSLKSCNDVTADLLINTARDFKCQYRTKRISWKILLPIRIWKVSLKIYRKIKTVWDFVTYTHARKTMAAAAFVNKHFVMKFEFFKTYFATASFLLLLRHARTHTREKQWRHL